MIIEPDIMSYQTHPLIEAITQPLAADKAEMSLVSGNASQAERQVY